MLVNKEELRISAGGSVEGPEKYFKISVEKIDGGDVREWHIADRDGKRSYNLGGAGVANVDLVLGQGRVAGQAMLKDVGRAMGVRMSSALAQSESPSKTGSLPMGILGGIGILALGLGGVGYEVGRRKRS